MKKRISLIVILLVLPLFIGIVTSNHYSEDVEAVTEDSQSNHSEVSELVLASTEIEHRDALLDVTDLPDEIVPESPLKSAPESIDIEKENYTIGIREQLQITSTVFPETASQVVSWFSLDPSVASVSGNGNVVGESQGTTIIVGQSFTGIQVEVNVVVEEFTFSFSGIEENAVATVTDYSGTNTEITIPSIAINHEMGWVREIPVVAIGDSAFYEKGLTRVSFPFSIERIGHGAFARNSIETIDLPEMLTYIGLTAFEQNNLIELSIPDKVYEIGGRAFSENRSLNQVILGDGLEVIGNGMFINAPLRTIVVSEERLEKYRQLLNDNVMVAAVSSVPVLQVGEDRYIDGTNLEMKLDYGDRLELGVISKNRYQMEDTYVWQALIPVVQWYKNDLELVGEANSLFTINNVQEDDSGLYHTVIEGTTLEPIRVSVSPRMNPDIPPIDPTDPNLIFPGNPNPTIGTLSLRFVPDLEFNEISVSSSEQIIYSKPTIDMNGQEIPNMVTVQDMRPVEERDSWNLTVKQSDELVSGARIKMNPYVHIQNKENLGIEILNTSLIINSGFQSFATSNNAISGGILSLGLHAPDDHGVQLELPKNTAIGEYNTTLIWNLVSAP